MAEEFIWDERYSVGDEALDAQHRRLFELGNEVARLSGAPDQADSLKKAVHALCDYVKTHFSDEERFMERKGFPRLTEHRVLHESIIHQINETLRSTHNLEALAYKLKRLLRYWVLEHIEEEDLKLKRFLEKVEKQAGKEKPSSDGDTAPG